ncbi:MAG TPA: nitroreductase family deazaflavin-dependent oxidoreductase [Thermomicrobiales bacterium]|nr:nitroreductase family deazaflavin-dependent oxidoreductase [Thermomicrobiales bacterium]
MESYRMNEFNQQIVDEFRENGGKVGGYFEGANMILLTTIGRETGEPRIVPLVYFPDGERILVVASAGGSPAHPDWYHNLRENPDVTVEQGHETFQAKATALADPARAEKFAEIVAVAPGFGEYQEKTTRVIPVVALQRENAHGSERSSDLT